MLDLQQNFHFKRNGPHQHCSTTFLALKCSLHLKKLRPQLAPSMIYKQKKASRKEAHHGRHTANGPTDPSAVSDFMGWVFMTP